MRRTGDLLGVNEWQRGRCWSLAQVVSLRRSHEVGAGRRGCCTCLLYRAAAYTVILGVARPHHSITASGDPSPVLTAVAQITSWAGLGLLTARTPPSP
jgi:hypothetical protein